MTLCFSCAIYCVRLVNGALITFPLIQHVLLWKQNNYMEGSGSATIKYRSPSQAPRGRGNHIITGKQQQTN